MLNLNSIMIGTKQPTVLVAFYEKALGKPADFVDPSNGFWGWQVGSAFLSVLEHSAIEGSTKEPGRVMFNFETDQASSVLIARTPPNPPAQPTSSHGCGTCSACQRP
ncbi:MAG: hypothetical protein SH847_13095, partial [Roseiflexaceae bacterium]|nr:hypothetical protein [Roseiflexaceae bacterium]